MSCQHNKMNADCPCTHNNCAQHGKCCECVAYHRSHRQLPACFFDAEAERTGDRSVEFYISRMNSERK